MKKAAAHKHLSHKAGFTLVETLIVSALVGILSLFITSVYVGTTSLFSKQSLEIQVVQAATALSDTLLSNIRTAEFIKDTLTNGSDTYESSEDELILAVPAIDPYGDAIEGVYDHYVFYQDATATTDFRWKLLPNGASDRTSFDKLAAEEITALTITYDTPIPANANIVTVSFTLEKGNPRQTIEISRSTSANLRNQ